MVLKNAWYKYDRLWVIGDLHLAKDPAFRMEAVSKKTGLVVYENVEEYMQSVFTDEFERVVYTILDEHIANGTETLTHLELAVQYCMRMGMFDDEYRRRRIDDFIEEIKAMTEETDDWRYHEVLAIIGGDPDNITADGMEFVERKTYEKLVSKYVAPKYLLPDEKTYASWEFYRNLRFAVTKLIGIRVFKEI